MYISSRATLGLVFCLLFSACGQVPPTSLSDALSESESGADAASVEGGDAEENADENNGAEGDSEADDQGKSEDESEAEEDESGDIDASTSEDAEASDADSRVRGANTRAYAPAPSEGLSADMLSESEMDDAVAKVLADTLTVQNAVDRDAESMTGSSSLQTDNPNYRVLYTQRHADKYSEERAAEVAIYRYDTDTIELNKVNLDSGEVEVLDIPDDYPVPLVRDELDEATLAALRDPDARKAIEDAGMDPTTVKANGLLTQSADPDNPCFEHRCVRLFFADFEDVNIVPRFTIIVDINALKVVEIVDFPNFEETE